MRLLAVITILAAVLLGDLGAASAQWGPRPGAGQMCPQAGRGCVRWERRGGWPIRRACPGWQRARGWC